MTVEKVEPQSEISILHVDDEPDVAELAAEFLERIDDRFDVVITTSADEALDRLEGQEVDCVVSDYDMPETNGIEFLEAVRERDDRLPFILFTGKGSEAVASEALSAGATEYLQKGTGAEQYELLANRIENAVEQFYTERRAETLDRIRTLIGDVNQALVRSSTREELERDVCAVLSESDPYRFAWFGEPDPETGIVEPRTAGGIDEGYLEAITVTVDDTETSRGPVGRALRSGGFAVSQDVQHDPEFEPWREEAIERGFQAVAAVPLVYGDDVYGSLAVYADRPYAFDETERNLLVELGDDIAHALYRLDTQAELQRRNRQLQKEIDRRKEAETRYRSLFENNPVVIWVEDFSAAKQYVDELTEDVEDLPEYLEEHPEVLDRFMNRIELLDVNENAVEYYGADSKADLLANLDRVMTDEGRQVNEEMLLSIAADERRFSTETVSRTYDGERRHEIFELYVPEAYADDYSRVYITGTDITERKRKERELERQYDRLETLADVLGDDIESHLATATESIGLARETEDLTHLDRIEETHERVASLVEDMRSFVRAGLDVDDLEWVELASIVGSRWNSCCPEPEAGTVLLEDHGRLRADERRLAGLFEHLFWNACQHGGDDVTVRVGLLEEGFYVADDGPGIPDERREAVLSPGYTTDDEEHLGFGLTIVYEIADAHGWDVRVTESEAGGARFEFTDVDVVTQQRN